MALPPRCPRCDAVLRPEVVLFGEEPYLRKPFDLMCGPFILRAIESDQRCMITHFSASHHAPEHRQCAYSLMEILHVLAEMGATYPEVVSLLQEADAAGCLSCRVRCDALPQSDISDLIKAGSGTLELSNGDTPPLDIDLGPIPELYRIGSGDVARPR